MSSFWNTILSGSRPRCNRSLLLSDSISRRLAGRRSAPIKHFLSSSSISSLQSSDFFCSERTSSSGRKVPLHKTSQDNSYNKCRHFRRQTKDIGQSPISGQGLQNTGRSTTIHQLSINYPSTIHSTIHSFIH